MLTKWIYVDDDDMYKYFIVHTYYSATVNVITYNKYKKTNCM